MDTQTYKLPQRLFLFQANLLVTLAQPVAPAVRSAGATKASHNYACESVH